MNLFKTLSMVCVLGACATAARATEFVDLADARPGRTGVCVTEMDGGERVEVPLTVLGVIGTGAPEGEIILVRLDDPRFEETGIIAGMITGTVVGSLTTSYVRARAEGVGETCFVGFLQRTERVILLADQTPVRRRDLRKSGGRRGGRGAIRLRNAALHRAGAGVARSEVRLFQKV
mgnify:CR=1 FL=1